MAHASGLLDTFTVTLLEESEEILMDKIDPDILTDVLLSMDLLPRNKLTQIQGACRPEVNRILLEHIKCNCTKTQYDKLCAQLQARNCELVAHIMKHGADRCEHGHDVFEILVAGHFYLAENLDLTLLLPYLQGADVITMSDADTIRAARGSFKQNCVLLDMLQTKPCSQIEQFVKGLIATKQIHLSQRMMPSVTSFGYDRPDTDPKMLPEMGRTAKANYRIIIEENIMSLAQNIEMKSILWDKLIENDIIKHRDALFLKETILDETKQAKEVLKMVIRRDYNDYLKFRESLISAGQGNVVGRWLPDSESEELVHLELRNTLADVYLSRYKRIILWGSGINPVPAQFDSLYTEMTWVNNTIEAERTEMEHYTDAVASGFNQNILIWGEAGIGKSTFCAKLCKDWASVVTGQTEKGTKALTKEQKRKLNSIKLLVHIVLTEIDFEQSLEQIFASQYDMDEGSIQMFKHALQNGYITLLLDSLDELAYKQGDIISILMGKHYKNVTWIVTSRTHTVQGGLLYADAELQLKGFSETQAKLFVEMYARNKFMEKEFRIFAALVWREIESSADLLEMSGNPSMLQLMCILYSQTGRIGKDKAEVLKHYTKYLLIQYHNKKCGDIPYSDDVYKDLLLKTGRLALKGLKLSHLQFVFSKQLTMEMAGQIIFDVGFVNELPNVNPDKVKVQFISKTLQEYLAAFYVVNTPGDEGLHYLMDFCSTSQRLMGSQMILSFIAAMSRRMGKIIQKIIREYVSSCSQDDDVNSKSRTAFLIAMLRSNKSLVFPLPTVVDLDLREYESQLDRFKHFFGRRTTLERFLSMDARGVKKICVVVGHCNRSKVLLHVERAPLDELLIDYDGSTYKSDTTHLIDVVTKLTPRILCISNCVSLDLLEVILCLGEIHTLILVNFPFTRKTLLQTLKKLKHIKILKIKESRLCIDDDLAEAICNLPDYTQLDLSDLKIVKMSTNLLGSLLWRLSPQKIINLSNTGIEIDAELAREISKLPEHVQLDITGNKLVKMENKTLGSLICRLGFQNKIDLSELDIKIDNELTTAILKLPKHVQLDISGNNVIDQMILIKLIRKAADLSFLWMKTCEVDITKDVAEAIYQLPEDTNLDLSGNKISEMEMKLLSKVLKYIPQQEAMDIYWKGFTLDIDIIKALARLTSLKSLITMFVPFTWQAEIELANTVRWFPKLELLNLFGCGISNDACVALVASLSKYCPLLEKLILDYNNLSSGVWQVLNQVTQMKNLQELRLEGNPCLDDETLADQVRNALSKTNLQLVVHMGFQY